MAKKDMKQERKKVKLQLKMRNLKYLVVASVLILINVLKLQKKQLKDN